MIHITKKMHRDFLTEIEAMRQAKAALQPNVKYLAISGSFFDKDDFLQAALDDLFDCYENNDVNYVFNDLLSFYHEITLKLANKENREKLFWYIHERVQDSFPYLEDFITSDYFGAIEPDYGDDYEGDVYFHYNLYDFDLQRKFLLEIIFEYAYS
jgi:hypothetical protein